MEEYPSRGFYLPWLISTQSCRTFSEGRVEGIPLPYKNTTNLWTI